MDLLDCAEDHRRGPLHGPAHHVPWSVAVMYLGEPLLDRHGLPVRARSHVAASQHAGQDVRCWVELGAQDVGDPLELVTTSSDASALAALEHARTYHAMWRDFIPLPPAADGDDAESSPGFASGNWRRAVAGRRHPGVVVRRHFQAMVFTYLAGNCAPGTLRWPTPGSTPTGASTCCPGQGASRPGGVCAEVALPGTAAGFAERLRHAHLNAPAGLDAGYEPTPAW